MFYLLFLLVLAFIFGIVVTLLVELFVFHRYFTQVPFKGPIQEPLENNVLLPQILLSLLKKGSMPKQESCWAFNLIFQFLFKELKNTERVRRWFLRKLTLEFEEVLTKTTTGKLFESVAIRSLDLGDQFPVIKDIEITNVQLHPENTHIELLELKLDVEYIGGFHLAVDANMKLGRSAYLSLQVKHLSGQARLQFSRRPYSHWNFSFLSEPVMDLNVESQFQGRPLHQITTLIASQIRRAIRKKHTLPNFKLRYKPFFPRSNKTVEFASLPPASSFEESRETLFIPKGPLKVRILEVTRLPSQLLGGNVYVTLASDNVPWVEMVHYDHMSQVTLDLSIIKAQSQVLGLTFRQAFDLDAAQLCLVIEAVPIGSPAALGGVLPSDILLCVQGKAVRSVNEATKLIKSAHEKLSLRVERRSVLRVTSITKTGVESSELQSQQDIPILKASPPSSANNSPSSHRTVLRRRRGSLDAKKSTEVDLGSSSSQSSQTSTPMKKPIDVGFRRSSEEVTCSRGSLTSDVTWSQDEVPNKWEWTRTVVKRTQDKPPNVDVMVDEILNIEVENGHRFLNIGVWSISKSGEETPQKKRTSTVPQYKPTFTKDTLLSHLSISLSAIAMECSTTTLGHFIKDFQLLPPDQQTTLYQPLASHSGFETSMCFGLATLSFVYSGAIGLDDSSEKHSQTQEVAENRIPGLTQQHSFLRTHFHSATQCGYCKKKIWLKDAYQCSICCLACHKKCLVRCQAHTVCNSNDDVLSIDTIPSPSQQERHSLSLDIEKPLVRLLPATPQSAGRSVTNFLSSVAANVSTHSGMKRVGSATNLAPPQSQQQGGGSRSLPPSPQHSPTTSRKSSLTISNPFELLDSGEGNFSLAVDQLVASANDERLVAAAKETGKEIYAEFSIPERKERLNAMLTKVQTEMDSESMRHQELAKRNQSTNDNTEKMRIAIAIAKSEERVRALAVLMLYYCTGLQHVNDLDESKDA